MINEASRQQLESIKERARLNSSIEKLRSRLRNFTVINRQGDLIGEVKDLILESNHQINFVISQTYSAQKARLFLLVSKLVQKVDPSNQSVIVDINKAEIEHFPEYIIKETPGMEISEIPDTPETPDYAAVDENITQDSNVYPSVVPVVNADIFGMDVDYTSTSSSELANTQDQNIMPDIDLYPVGIDTSSVEVVDGASTSFGEPADTQELEQGAIDNNTSEVLEEELIRLLGERLVVNRSKRKVGEVIVRKEIETRMVQVPVRYEKLIVEQVSPEHKQLAEIDLGEEEISAIDLTEAEVSGVKLPETTSKLSEADLSGELTVKGEFSSPKIASLLLNAIALERRHGCKKVRVEIVVEEAERQKTYQEWVKRSSR